MQLAIAGLFLMFLLSGVAAPGLMGAEDAASPSIPPGYVRYVTQPNGWGDTPEAAIRDLRQRILPWYQKTFGHRPGFEVDWKWVALVEVADGREWQADGRVSWWVPRAKVAKPIPQRTSQARLRSK